MAPTHVLRSSFESRLQKFHLQPPSIDRSDFIFLSGPKAPWPCFFSFFPRDVGEANSVCTGRVCSERRRRVARCGRCGGGAAVTIPINQLSEALRRCALAVHLSSVVGRKAARWQRYRVWLSIGGQGRREERSGLRGEPTHRHS